jgi:hypothetical protein
MWKWVDLCGTSPLPHGTMWKMSNSTQSHLIPGGKCSISTEIHVEKVEFHTNPHKSRWKLLNFHRNPGGKA